MRKLNYLQMIPIYYFFHSKDLVKLFTFANIGMLQLYDWFKVNKLSFNVDKTCSVFGPNLLCIFMAKLLKM